MIDLEFYKINIAHYIEQNLITPKIKDDCIFDYIKVKSNIKGKKWKVGDILYSNQNNILTDVSEGNKAIAVCVIPSDFIPNDPKARFVSLDDLAIDHVYNIGWGDITLDISELTNRFCIPNILAIQAIAGNTRYECPCNGYNTFVASDLFTYNEIPCSNVALGQPNFNGLAPNPYIMHEDGSYEFNQEYIATTLNGQPVNNVLCDFNGEYNTDVIMSHNTITELPKFPAYTNKHNWYPAAYACRNHKTLGTKAGNWYLPSISELTIMYAKISEINNVLKGIKGAFEILTDGVYWSSNQGCNWGAFFLKMSLGGINVEYKTFAYNVRAFLKL